MDTEREPALPPFVSRIVSLGQHRRWAYERGRRDCNRTHQAMSLKAFDIGHAEGREQGRREGAWTALVAVTGLVAWAAALVRGRGR